MSESSFFQTFFENLVFLFSRQISLRSFKVFIDFSRFAFILRFLCSFSYSLSHFMLFFFHFSYTRLTWTCDGPPMGSPPRSNLSPLLPPRMNPYSRYVISFCWCVWVSWTGRHKTGTRWLSVSQIRDCQEKRLTLPTGNSSYPCWMKTTIPPFLAITHISWTFLKVPKSLYFCKEKH